MADLFDGYPLGDVWDEMFADAGSPRPAYSGLYAAVQGAEERCAGSWPAG